MNNSPPPLFCIAIWPTLRVPHTLCQLGFPPTACYWFVFLNFGHFLGAFGNTNRRNSTWTATNCEIYRGAMNNSPPALFCIAIWQTLRALRPLCQLGSLPTDCYWFIFVNFGHFFARLSTQIDEIRTGPPQIAKSIVVQWITLLPHYSALLFARLCALFAHCVSWAFFQLTAVDLFL